MQNNHRKIIQIPSPPRRGKFRIPPDELRYELPFDPVFRNLVYIDRLSHDKWFTPLQIHDYFEMCYVVEGTGWFILDDVKHEAGEGELFVTKPHEIHGGGASGNGPFTMYSLGFRFEEWNELETDYYVLGRDRIVRDRLGAVPQWCEKLMKECENGEPYAAMMGKAFLTALLTGILRLYSARGSRSSCRSCDPSLYQIGSFRHASRLPCQCPRNGAGEGLGSQPGPSGPGIQASPGDHAGRIFAAAAAGAGQASAETDGSHGDGNRGVLRFRFRSGLLHVLQAEQRHEPAAVSQALRGRRRTRI